VHACSEVELWVLEQEVVVVRHQAVRVACPGSIRDDGTEHPQERQVVLVVEEDAGAIVPAVRDVTEEGFHTSTVRGEPSPLCAGFVNDCNLLESRLRSA
jgi:hypothetical protein